MEYGHIHSTTSQRFYFFRFEQMEPKYWKFHKFFRISLEIQILHLKKSTVRLENNFA